MTTEETPLLSSSQADGNDGSEPGAPSSLRRLRENIGDREKQFRDEDKEPHYGDGPSDMTFSRRLARILSSFAWYDPHAASRREYESGGEGATKTKPPSLDAAWAYFEHITLARHFLGRGAGRDVREKAEPGEIEKKTRLYSVLSTPEEDLADFGIGVGIYFFTLRILSYIAFVAGLICLPNIFFFGSDEYNDAEFNEVNPILRGSAICTDSTWEACPTCTKEQWDKYPSTYDRYAETSDGLTFIKVNHCDVGFKDGFVSWICLLFVCVSIYVLGKVVQRKCVEFDESSLTTTDYSVEVENPPVDARDPEEWRDFFSQFGGHVTCCTVALDNEDLIRSLAKRRELVLSLELMLPPGAVFDKENLDKAVEDAMPLTLWQRLMFCNDAQAIRTQIADLDEEIESMSQETYNVSNVFVTLEHERTQRNALTQLSVRRWDILTKNTSALPENLLFRGKHVLAVREPPEPSDVRWQDLDESFQTQIYQRITTFFLSSGAILGACILITYMRSKRGAAATAITVTACNSVTPAVCRYITEKESHSSESSKQASLYVKISACLWFNTAIISALITPFADTLSNEDDSIIHAMYAIFITEMLKAPITQFLDIPGHVNRHILGPRAPDQRRMNLCFQGTAYELSERYTDMTSILFLTFYYGSIFPAGFFFASLTLMVHYWTDKFCLLRNWSPAPLIGTYISEFCRNYFMTAALLAFAVMSSYNFSSFPYDNACEDSSSVSSEYVGDFIATDGDGIETKISLEEGNVNFFYCNQDILRYPAFPALPSEQPEGTRWMTDGQERLSSLFGWTSIAVLIFVAAIFVNRIFIKAIRGILFSPNKPSGEPGEYGFSEVNEIFGYVPQIKIPGYLFPVLLCDISGIDPGLVGWTDPETSGTPSDTHSIIYDLPCLVEKEANHNESNENSIFSIVKEWPPPNKG